HATLHPLNSSRTFRHCHPTTCPAHHLVELVAIRAASVAVDFSAPSLLARASADALPFAL
ncbi:MAG: hypothetical protein WA673_00620, partial [Candidatus Acidiferrales bacterium]